MAVGTGLGFLVGSVLVLLAVLYYTRIRRSGIPHAGTIDPDPTDPKPRTRRCDRCERERPCREIGDLVVCADCADDRMA